MRKGELFPSSLSSPPPMKSNNMFNNVTLDQIWAHKCVFKKELV